MRFYVVYSGNDPREVEAPDLDTVRARVVQDLQGLGGLFKATAWLSYQILDEAGRVLEEARVRVDPFEPGNCRHNWVGPGEDPTAPARYEVQDGRVCEVWVCQKCGWRRIDCPAGIEYRRPDARSRAWATEYALTVLAGLVGDDPVPDEKTLRGWLRELGFSPSMARRAARLFAEHDGS